MQSAATRKANARTAAIADSRVSPYAMTPGMDSMSAHQRPSSSRPTTIGIDSTVTVSIDFYYNSCELSINIHYVNADKEVMLHSYVSRALIASKAWIAPEISPPTERHAITSHTHAMCNSQKYGIFMTNGVIRSPHGTRKPSPKSERIHNRPVS